MSTLKITHPTNKIKGTDMNNEAFYCRYLPGVAAHVTEFDRNTSEGNRSWFINRSGDHYVSPPALGCIFGSAGGRVTGGRLGWHWLNVCRWGLLISNHLGHKGHQGKLGGQVAPGAVGCYRSKMLASESAHLYLRRYECASLCPRSSFCQLASGWMFGRSN